MRIPILESGGFEADDVIGTVARRASEGGCEVMIVSSDKDMLQLVNDRISMLNPMKDDFVYDPIRTEVFMGVKPSQVADLLALKGDSVDNIPGAPGIGEKGAKDIILKFPARSKRALNRASEVDRKMYRESLQNNRAQIESLEEARRYRHQRPNRMDPRRDGCPNLDLNIAKVAIYKEMEFFSLLRDLGSK